MNRFDEITVAELVAGLADVTIFGNPDVVCRDALPLCDAQPGSVTLIDDLSRRDELIRSGATAVVTAKRHEHVTCTQIIAANVHAVFTAIVKQFRHSTPSIVHSSIDASAQIDPTASIGNGTRIDAGVIVGPGVQVGNDCHLMPGVVVMEQSRIGDRCTLYPRVVLYEHTHLEHDIQIHAGSVLGAHGFGYRQVAGQHVATAQLGYVHVESHVDIGANVTIDRGTYGATRIGSGTKIDNLVMIAHNCHIGKHNLICSQVGIAGSCRTGDYVVLAGQAGVADHITLGDHVVVGAQAGVMDNLPSHQTYLGSPATLQREHLQIVAVQRRLPEIRREVRTLRRDVDDLTSASTSDAGLKTPDPVHELPIASDDADVDVDHPCCLQFRRPAA